MRITSQGTDRSHQDVLNRFENGTENGCALRRNDASSDSLLGLFHCDQHPEKTSLNEPLKWLSNAARTRIIFCEMSHLRRLEMEAATKAFADRFTRI
ncbi:hypothetical protein Tcan_18197 [Toxocara canis]|uniref:Uncharacterized protein n=1 Tax=Toxocara canis TaxID=6265 RepID=A0A0B2V3G8_TOXCA|nr:hypothetical protein Tcan_18197 [Toxocara canis]